MFHCRIAVAVSLILESNGDDEEAAQVDEGNSLLLTLIQEAEVRGQPNVFTNLIKSSKLAKDTVESERMIQAPLFQASLEQNALIRKSDSMEFGVEWLVNLFECLVRKMSNLIRRLYRGSPWGPVSMSWITHANGREELAPDPLAIAFLGQQWDIQKANADTCALYSDMLAE